MNLRPLVEIKSVNEAAEFCGNCRFRTIHSNTGVPFCLLFNKSFVFEQKGDSPTRHNVCIKSEMAYMRYKNHIRVSESEGDGTKEKNLRGDQSSYKDRYRGNNNNRFNKEASDKVSMNVTIEDVLPENSKEKILSSNDNTSEEIEVDTVEEKKGSPA